MVQTSFTTVAYKQQLAGTLGHIISEAELNPYLKYAIVQEPTAGQLFWQATDAEPGIYLVIKGKVRLLDSTNELIATLHSGTSFGESTLFPTGSFQPYSARGSVNLQLYFLPPRLLRELCRQYPSIKEHLYRQAVLQDLLLQCPQMLALRNSPGVMKALYLVIARS
jgi:signal-transduction protein with cAMP-binding, CBS, and nucleotidyltransferase domain